MKKIKQKLIAAILVLLVFVTGISVLGYSENEQASAQTWEYNLYYDYDIIYYFSDSAPAFSEYFENSYSAKEIVYDSHWFLTEQEFKYMLCTGYFWGFNQNCNNIAVIELKFLQLDDETLYNLFYCLQSQGCKILYINPEISAMRSTDYGMEMPCNKDAYSKFIKNSMFSIRYMNNEIFPDGASLFLDNRIVSIEFNEKNYNAFDICINSPALRYLISDIYYNGHDQEYGKELYESLWTKFTEVFELDYVNLAEASRNVADYITIWKNIDESPYGYSLSRQDFWDYNNPENIELFNEYFSTVLAGLNSRDINVVIHSEDSTYINLNYSGEYKMFNVINYLSDDNLFKNIRPAHIFAIGIWYLKQNFYNLLTAIQHDLIEFNGAHGINTTRPIVYVWEQDPIVPGDDGLEVVTASDLSWIDGEDKYDYSELLDYFKDCLNAL